jgi:23S rRNA (uracil1939-C5)-methyltransferase
VGVEGSNEAITQATDNAIFNGISNTAFYTADLSADLGVQSWVEAQYDKMLLDPPRAGAKELMPYIQRWNPQRIVYVSCNPITLARDTQHLLQLGYRLEKAGVMDMFPHTEHIEAIALFVRRSAI